MTSSGIPSTFQPTLGRWLLVAAFFSPVGAWAQSPTLQTPDQANVLYRVQAGDTLNGLWSRLLQANADRSQVLQLNQIGNADRISVGQTLSLPRHMLKFTLGVAHVVNLTCDQAIVVSPASKPLSIGAHVTEGDVIRVPADCHITLAVEDGSIIRLPSSATLKFTTLRKNALEAEPEVRLDLVSGRMEISVKKNRSRLTPFEVTTPKSVMGVRGTEFRVGYSPEDSTAQVEVISGTVAAQGGQDSTAQHVEKGYGLPIDAQGRAQALEQLLPPPTFASSQRIMPSVPGRWLLLTPMVEAKAYVASSASTANMGGARYTQTLQEPKVPVAHLKDTAVFYEFLAIAQSGIHGQPIRYGFCEPSGSSQRCNVSFDVPLADGVAMSIDLDRVQAQTTQALIKGHTIKARQGRFSVQNLAPGRYQWELRHQLNRSEVSQTGQFELIAIGREQP
jgi:hypothetical protein